MDGLRANDRRMWRLLESVQTHRADGRMSVADLYRAQARLLEVDDWRAHEVFAETLTTPDGHDLALPVNVFVTTAAGPALWIITGIHGEEPAGPNALAGHLSEIVALQRAGVPMVVLPLCNPSGYCKNWRYPDAERYEEGGGGYSVGDSEHWLPDETGRARSQRAASRQCEALTRRVLDLAQTHPPRLALDLHEDDTLERGYLYSQGSAGSDDPVGRHIVDVLDRSGFPLEESGQTRFHEPICGGMVSGVRDGSIDELLAAAYVVREGALAPGPAGRSVLVIETGSKGKTLAARVAGHRCVLRILDELWEIALPG